jgi:hypothetical protein
MRTVLLILSVLTCCSSRNVLWAQSAFYLEGLGHGLLYSVNYDYGFDREPGGLGFKIGLSYIPIEDSDVLSIPVSLNYLKGAGPGFFELGVGVDFFKGKANFLGDYDFGSSNFGFIASVGYRYQKPKGLLFRVGLTPILSNEIFVPYFAGISIGYSL